MKSHKKPSVVQYTLCTYILWAIFYGYVHRYFLFYSFIFIFLNNVEKPKAKDLINYTSGKSKSKKSKSNQFWKNTTILNSTFPVTFLYVENKQYSDPVFYTRGHSQTMWTIFWTFLTPPPPLWTILLYKGYRVMWIFGKPPPPLLSTWFVNAPFVWTIKINISNVPWQW